MNLSDAIRKRCNDEYAELRDLDHIEYAKCAALASHFASRIANGAEESLNIAADIEAALMSYALKSVKASASKGKNDE